MDIVIRRRNSVFVKLFGCRISFFITCMGIVIVVSTARGRNKTFFNQKVGILFLSITPDKTLLSFEKYSYFSYFSTKTYVVGTH